MFIDFREGGGGKEGKEERERNIYQLPPICAPIRDWTRIPGLCTEWKPNPQSFGARDDTPTPWATQPGWNRFCSQKKIKLCVNEFHSKQTVYFILLWTAISSILAISTGVKHNFKLEDPHCQQRKKAFILKQSLKQSLMVFTFNLFFFLLQEPMITSQCQKV